MDQIKRSKTADLIQEEEEEEAYEPSSKGHLEGSG